MLQLFIPYYVFSLKFEIIADLWNCEWNAKGWYEEGYCIFNSIVSNHEFLTIRAWRNWVIETLFYF